MNEYASKETANPANGNEYFFPALLCTTGLMPTNTTMMIKRTALKSIMFSFQTDQTNFYKKTIGSSGRS